MSNEDLQQLKALALAATPGPWDRDEELTPWRIAGGEVAGGDGSGVSVVFTGYDWQVKVGEESDTGSSIYESTGEPATIVEGARNADAAFIAAANPATILAMIERIESVAAPAVANGAAELPEPLEEVRAKFRGEWDYAEAGDRYYTQAQIVAYGQACTKAIEATNPLAPNALLVAALQDIAKLESAEESRSIARAAIASVPTASEAS